VFKHTLANDVKEYGEAITEVTFLRLVLPPKAYLFNYAISTSYLSGITS
jgi:hypothetical protein